MLSETLRRFLKSQKPTPFTLPDGEEINLKSKKDRARVHEYILDLYGGDDEAADAALCDIIPQAVRNANRPWPYLIKAVENNSQEWRKNLVPVTGTVREIAKLFSSRMSRSRKRLLKDVVQASEVSTVDIENHQYNLADEGDYAKTARWLMGNDPYPLFHLLSPQKYGRYMAPKGIQRIVDDLVAIRLRLTEMESLVEHRATVIAILNSSIHSFTLWNETSEAIIIARQYYSSIQHAILYLVKEPRGRVYKTHSEHQASIIERLKLACYRNSDRIRSEWLNKALRLGIIVDPLDWILRLSEGQPDPCEEWMDRDWFNEELMKTAYGLQNVSSLFPDLIVRNG